MASPQQSGYQCQFVDSVEDYKCLLCLHVTREPFLTSCCGQHFCQVCIGRILTDNKPCTFCKENSFTTLLDKKQKRGIMSLKVYCEKKAEGCQWMSGLGELEQHLGENCEFVEVNCPNKCGLAIQRQLLAKHQANNCLNRPYSCQYCKLKATYKEIQDNHLPVCPKYPVTCPNQCGVSPLERDQLEDHLRECPLQLVECELKIMGCEEMVKWKDLVRHMEEETQKHLTLMASKYLKTQADVTKLQKENEVLKKELTEIRREAFQKDETISNMSCQLKLIKQHFSINTTQLHINFTTLRNMKGIESENNSVWTFTSKCKMRASLYPSFQSKRLDIALTHVEAAVDCNLQWPKKFTMTVRLVNKAGDHDHYQVTKDMTVYSGGTINDEIGILYSTIESPPQGVQYINNDHITLQILVTEK